MADHPCPVCEGAEEAVYESGEGPAYGPCFVCDPAAVSEWLAEAAESGFAEQVETVREDIEGWKAELAGNTDLGPPRATGPAAC